MLLGYLLRRGYEQLHSELDQRGTQVHAIAAFLLACVVVFFVAYWVRAGSAHLRIGMLQTMGLQAPECFNRPYLAVSPIDFWRRWNCWVGDWVRRYLFMPLALTLSRRAPRYRLAKGHAQALALLVSFLGMGALHEWLPYIGQGTTSFAYLQAFGFAAIGAISWEALAAWRRGSSREAAPTHWTSRLATAAYVGGMLTIIRTF
jgi:D-alanyl-lipoteichoic acid acyltransferase DltB (MBOAT superfamily)